MAIKRDEIKRILEELELSPIFDEQMDGLTEEWKSWYKGFVQDFHEYKNYQGTDYAQTIRMYTMNMWKQIAELWADNMYNPETEETLEGNQEWWDDTKIRIRFEQNFNNLQERIFALGNTATVEYIDSTGKTEIDYIGYENIIPLEVVNGEVVSCAFYSQYTENVIYFNIHQREDDGSYTILNKFYITNDEGDITGEIPVEAFGEIGIELMDETYSEVKLFQLHKPAIVNNFNLQSPFGISVLANALDEIKAVDIAFNTLIKEAVHGKIRVYLREGSFGVSVDGEDVLPFNPNNEEFYMITGDDELKDGKINELVHVSTPTLRTEQLIDQLHTSLTLLARKVGLGDNTFSFKEGTIYTNTAQVVSSNSKFYKTRAKHGVIMRDNIESIIKGLYFLENGKVLEDTISVQMDDSIIHDKDEELNRVLQLRREGILSDVYVLQTFMNMTEEEAIAFKKRQQEIINEDLEEEVEFEGEEE